MSTRPFAYNPAGNILGTEQVGSLSVGIPTNGFESTSLKFWNGPNENLGYIIAQPDPQGSHTGADGVPAFLGFIRSSVKTEAAFIELVNTSFNQNFTIGDTAKAWLNTNGYWTSWAEVSGTPSPTPSGNAGGSGSWYFYSDAGQLNAPPPIQDGNAIFLIRDNQNGTLNETFNPNKVGGANEIYFNLNDINGTDYTTQFTNLQTNGGSITITQGTNYVTYMSTVPGVFFVEGQNGFFIIQAGQATQTMTSASQFVYGDPISITFS